MKRKYRKSRGFSLIELLVVLVIIGVLFVMGLFVFENSGQKSTGRAAQQLVGILRLARQHAVSARQWTLVVFPTRDGGVYSGAGGETIDKCLRSVTVLAVTNPMDGLALPNQIPPNMVFEFVADWKIFPKGIFFDEDPALAGNYLFRSPSTTFRYPMDPSTPNVLVRPMAVVMFRPNGRAYTMVGDSSTGKFWQDKKYSKIYLTSEKFYEASGGSLLPPQPVPGTHSVVEIGGKTGQVRLLEP